MRYDLGRRLKAVREGLGLSQREAAAAAGMTPQQLLDLESGRIRNPSIRTLARIAKAYGIGVDELIGHGRAFTRRELPKGLQELLDDPEWGPKLTQDWVETLVRLRHKGRTLRTKEEFVEAFLSLRRLFEDG
ncbi:MAG: helix-turn-helix transcriptional regulator [Armatimonadetes bacterium]|nr:helix-turn-helix transcriptional regulator [Armatimonadota bacterium]